MRIQNTPRAAQCKSHWLTQGGESYWLIPSFAHLFSCSSDNMEAPSVALCAFKMSQKLLNAHSKYYGSCSIFIKYRRRLEQHNRPS
jgi:hypothetical protein